MKINLSEQLKDILLGKKNPAIKAIDMQSPVKWFYRNCYNSVRLSLSVFRLFLYSCSLYVGYFCNEVWGCFFFSFLFLPL